VNPSDLNAMDCIAVNYGYPMIGRIIDIHHTTDKKRDVPRVRLQTNNTPKDDGLFSLKIQWFHGKKGKYLEPFGKDVEGNPLCVLQTA